MKWPIESRHGFVDGVDASWRDHAFGAFLCAVYVAILMATAPALGMSRDESFYVVAAQDYGRWMHTLWEDADVALEPETITQDWQYNHEHPGLAKAMFALSHLAHISVDGGLFADDSTSFRFPGMLSAGLLLWLIYIFGVRLFGRTAGFLAALAYAAMPRPFYHAHLDCFDVPITLALTFVVYAYWRALKSRLWIVLFGVAFGLALGVKHNAWITPGILVVHFVWMVLGVRSDRRRGYAVSPSVQTRPYWMMSLAVFGPIFFIATWPWLWDPETLMERLGWYIRFHLHHEHYSIAYLGETYFRPPFPVHYPFVMTLFTVPLVTLLLAFIGLGRNARALLPEFITRRVWTRGVRPDERRTDVLLFGSLLAPIFVIALPSTPIFGATKHWFPAYPFLVLYAGHGLVYVLRSVERAWPRLREGLRQPAWRTAAMLTVAAPMVVETAHSHPFGLSHYTPVAGGIAGAADLGMNRQFWGFTTGSVVPYLRQRLPNGGTVYLCDTTAWAWEMFHRDGVLPPDIRWSPSVSDADLVLVHHEDHFAEVEFQAWVAHDQAKLEHVLTYDGVPIISVYAKP